MTKWTKNKLVHTVHMNIHKSDIHIHGLDIHIHGPNIHIHIIFMDMVLHELLKVHTAHEFLWTMPWTPWIVMRGFFISILINPPIYVFLLIAKKLLFHIIRAEKIRNIGWSLRCFSSSAFFPLGVSAKPYGEGSIWFFYILLGSHSCPEDFCFIPLGGKLKRVSTRGPIESLLIYRIMNIYTPEIWSFIWRRRRRRWRSRFFLSLNFFILIQYTA